jgi:hypothetical protein
VEETPQEEITGLGDESTWLEGTKDLLLDELKILGSWSTLNILFDLS